MIVADFRTTKNVKFTLYYSRSAGTLFRCYGNNPPAQPEQCSGATGIFLFLRDVKTTFARYKTTFNASNIDIHRVEVANVCVLIKKSVRKKRNNLKYQKKLLILYFERNVSKWNKK